MIKNQKSRRTLNVKSLSGLFSTGRLSLATANKLSFASYSPTEVIKVNVCWVSSFPGSITTILLLESVNVGFEE